MMVMVEMHLHSLFMDHEIKMVCFRLIFVHENSFKKWMFWQKKLGNKFKLDSLLEVGAHA